MKLFKLQCTIIQAHPKFHSSKVPTIGIFLEIAMLKLLTNPRISRLYAPFCSTGILFDGIKPQIIQYGRPYCIIYACIYPRLLIKINALDIQFEDTCSRIKMTYPQAVMQCISTEILCYMKPTQPSYQYIGFRDNRAHLRSRIERSDELRPRMVLNTAHPALPIASCTGSPPAEPTVLQSKRANF